MDRERSGQDEATLRRYLLGLLPEAEADSIEEAYLARPEVWERLRGVEDDLLDDHAAGRLSPGDKEAFEKRYLASAPLRERVVAARALRLAGLSGSGRAVERASRARSIRWAAPVALASGLILTLLTEWNGERAPTTSLPSVVPSSPPSRRRLSTPPFVLALSPVLLRGQEGPAEGRMPIGTDTVLLELEGDRTILPAPPAVLEAALETVEGRPVWRGEAQREAGGRKPSLVASARVPAATLAPGDYLLTLSLRDVSEGTLFRYFFRIRP
jgi:hypothetical protein